MASLYPWSFSILSVAPCNFKFCGFATYKLSWRLLLCVKNPFLILFETKYRIQNLCIQNIDSICVLVKVIVIFILIHTEQFQKASQSITVKRNWNILISCQSCFSVNHFSLLRFKLRFCY